MEQQPGPVNWAPHNPALLPGMVRLWTSEAFAHGAEVVAYFRWRQAPFGQEQLHAGLYLPDDSPRGVTTEVRRVAEELGQIPEHGPHGAPVALIFDYESQWLLDIQPHGVNFSYLRLVYGFYSALRQLGIDLDILPVDAPLDGYRAVVIPSLPILPEDLMQRLTTRSGSKTVSCQIPGELPPGPLCSACYRCGSPKWNPCARACWRR
jgi:beta-galactosidase